MKKAALYAGIIAALVCGTTFAAVISGVSAGAGSVYPTPVPAQYVAASYGSALANESIAAGADTALYCAMDNLDGTTSTPECGLNAIRHKGVGPFSDADYFSSPGVNDIFDLPATGWTVTVVWQRALGDSQILIGAEQLNTAGWYLRDRGTAGAIHFGFYPGGAASVTAATAVGAAGTVHVATAGLDAVGNVQLKVDGYATQTALATGYTPATATLTAIGKAASFGGYSTLGTIMEIHVASDPFVEATVTARQAAIMSCRNAGRCIPTSADEVAYFGGDNYTIGGSWCGDYPTCSAAKTFSRQGTVTTRERRYSWPSISWTQVGTVPRVATSGLHRQGYGARHASIGPFSDANFVSMGTGVVPTSMHTAAHTACIVFTPDTFASQQVIWSQGSAGSGDGFYLFSNASSKLQIVYSSPSQNVTMDVKETNVVCWGRDAAGNIRAVANDEAVTAGAATPGWLPGSTPVRLGRYPSAGLPAVNTVIHEAFYTTTPMTSEYLVFLRDAVRRCTTQGNCIPRDANTVMHTNADEFTGGVLRGGVGGNWTTNGSLSLNAPDFYRNVNALRISAPGAGPYSVGNYFALDPLGTGEDALDFPGSFFACATFDATTLAAGAIMAGGYTPGGVGWRMQRLASGELECAVSTFAGGSGTVTTSTNAYAAGSLNLGCCGWDQNTDTIYARLNASATATGTKKYQPATGGNSMIGLNNSLGAPHAGRVYEILALNKAPTTAQLDTIHRRWLNHQALTGRPLTNTHTIDTSTYHSAGKVWTRGVNMQRQESAKSVVVEQYASAGVEVTAHTPVPPGYLISGGFQNAWTQDWILDTNSEGVTLVKNAALAPDGTMTAVTIRETATTATHQPYLLVRPAVTGAQAFSASIYIRPVSTNNCLRAVFYPNKGTLSPYNTIDIDLARDAQSTYSTYAGNPLNGHEHLADGWIRVWWSTGNATFNAEPNVAIRIQPGSAPCNFVAGGWAGNVNNGFDVWGGQFVYSSTTTTPPSIPIYPFCARGATCTAETVTVPNPLRPNGTDWTNSLLQSEDLATTWSGVNTAVLVNSVLAPDGSFTADKLYENDATNGVHYTLQAYTATAVPWTVSFKAKPAERSWLLVSPDAGASTASFDLSTCAAGAVSAGVTSTAAASSVTGWCDFSLTKTMAAGATSVHIFLCTAAGSCSYAGVAGSGVFLWGLQAEPASAASPYCPTTTAARTCGPGGATGKTVTNLIPYNENLLGTGWSAGAVTVDAATNADGLHLLTPVGSGNYVQTSPGIPTPSTAVVSASVKFQSDAATDVGTLCIYSSGFVSSSVCARESGAACATSSEDGGHSCCASGTFTTAADRISVHCVFGAATTSYFPFVSAGQYPSSNNTIYAGKMQLEPLAASGPYCGPTAAASRTCAPTQRWCVRVKDATPGNGSAWTLTTGTLLAAGGAYGGANSWNLQPYGTKVYVDSRGADGVAISMNADHTFTAGSTHTIVACLNDGVGTIYYDGSFTPAATGTVATFSAWPTSNFLGSGAAGAFPWNGTIGSLEFNSTGSPRDFAWDRRTP